MKKPHKHAELIKAWADGQAEVEYRYPKDDGSWSLWKDLTQCVFHEWYEYRFKAKPTPDVVVLSHFYYELLEEQWFATGRKTSNLKLTFNGETGEIKLAEVIL